jgi:alkanesulfonate monooxygenase SsuD/methylene tetrahydromethanopterin reductase-like flavin-dependent oxidoreductase (luciferase family)
MVALSVGVPNFGPWCAGDWGALLDVARAAEAAGVDRLVVTDHVVLGPHLDAYAWGRFPTAPDGPWLEPLTVLTAMAGVTRAVRLSTGILIAPLRPAAVLAKTVATLDVLSGGRVDLGVGVGWQREEYDALGLDFDDRGRLLDDRCLPGALDAAAGVVLVALDHVRRHLLLATARAVPAAGVVCRHPQRPQPAADRRAR